jgi:serine/threonine-protein kinase RsbW
VKTQHPELVRLDLPARHLYLRLLSDCIADLLKLVDGIVDAETVVYNIQLAAHESCTNIINHAYAGTDQGRIEIALRLDFEQLHLEIELYDTGRPFDWNTYNSPDLSEAQIHGYGLFIMQNLMDKVSYTSLSGRNRWHLVKNLHIQGG